ncbi:hypothetical protein Bbelb_374610 [Branchiostoma belcheri]|nr:hypothetical protein Bbelb_374610 [Branchiostoma belcheri]
MSMSARHTVEGNNRPAREEETDVGDHISTKYKRVDSDTCSLARRPSLDDTSGGLRPRQRPPTALESLASAPTDQSGTADVTEDRIFHERCGFTTTRRRLYEEAEDVPGHTSLMGSRPAKKNVQLAIGLKKVPTAVHSLLTSVELSSPTKCSVHSLATGIAGPLVSVAQQALADNKRRLRTVMGLRGELVEDGKANGCYNNPCYKGFHQKSTQLDKQAAADKHRQQSDSYRSSRKRASAKTMSKGVEKLMSETSPSPVPMDRFPASWIESCRTTMLVGNHVELMLKEKAIEELTSAAKQAADEIATQFDAFPLDLITRANERPHVGGTGTTPIRRGPSRQEDQFGGPLLS